MSVGISPCAIGFFHPMTFSTAFGEAYPRVFPNFPSLPANAVGESPPANSLTRDSRGESCPANTYSFIQNSIGLPKGRLHLIEPFPASLFDLSNCVGR